MDAAKSFQGEDTRHEGPRILLIEDSDIDAVILQRALKENIENVKCTRVSSLRAGEEILKNRQVDLVMLDLGLPDTDGPDDTCGRAARWAAEIPLLVITGMQDRCMAKKMVSYGIADFVGKDIIGRYPHRIADVVEFCLSRHERQKQLAGKIEKALREAHEKEEILGYFMGGYSINSGASLPRQN